MTLKDQISKDLQESRPTMLEFFASWCPHCQRMMPIVEELRQRIGSKANIIQIDVDKNPELTEEYGVKSYPWWFIYKDGQKVWEDGGEKPLSELEDMINRFV